MLFLSTENALLIAFVSQNIFSSPWLSACLRSDIVDVLEQDLEERVKSGISL